MRIKLTENKSRNKKNRCQFFISVFQVTIIWECIWNSDSVKAENRMATKSLHEHNVLFIFGRGK